MRVYIASSWKQAGAVRALAGRLRALGHTCYDFTDPTSRQHPSGPVPERDPAIPYRDFLSRPAWRAQMHENRMAIQVADLVILLLPAGSDAHADWALAVGADIRTVVVGDPGYAGPSKVHLWADGIYPDVDTFLETDIFERPRR